MVLIVLLVALIICIFFGMPIGFSLGVSALCSLASWGSIPLKLMVQRMFTGIDSFPLMAIPFFMLAGELMFSGGMLTRLFKFADALVGHIRGGLGHVNVMASMLFAGITGSALADTAALGSMEIPMMVEGGYDVDYSAAITAASSIVGPIIPPSIPMVIYAVAAGNVSIAGLFLAGAVPGILIGVAMMIYNYVISLKRNYPRRETRITFMEFIRIFRRAILVLMMPIIILGGILSGIFTPTEASAVAVAYAIIVGFFVTRELNFKGLTRALLNSGIESGVVLIVVGMSSIVSWILATQQVPQIAANFFLSLTDNPFIYLLCVNALLLFLGCFMDPTPAIILVTPILTPIAIALGIDPLHFGLVVVINLIVGLITPPVGLCLFIACGIAKISLERISKAVLPFVLVEIAVLFLITYVPSICLFLPKLLGYD
ncbi:MAG TPA: TRAP transporter large permease [Synergistaceae bacterium]|nr:TRAP transporter large permease [Synergistaceae bacterium]